MEPNCLIITGYGINCESECKIAFEQAGGKARIAHLNELIENHFLLDGFGMIIIPGGFSYGDDLGSGKVFANKMKFKLREPLLDFIKKGRLILGVCNGFQILVKAGLLPYQDFIQHCTLTTNESNHFEDRWCYLKTNQKSNCVFTKNIPSLNLPVRHGEGRFLVSDERILEELIANQQIALQYSDADGKLSGYPQNPNGSLLNIAGICDRSGRIFGMMPHPEAFHNITNSPFWPSGKVTEADGLRIFRNAVDYLKTL